MARAARPWFRFYVEAVSDRKLRRLTPAQRWLWVCVLAAARQSPMSGVLLISATQAMDDADLADLAGMTVKEVAKTMPQFELSEMIERDLLIGAWCVTKWKDRQFESDDITERTRKHRSNHPERNELGTFQRGSKERSGNDDGMVLGTMTDTEADTDSKSSSSSPPPNSRPPDDRLDDDEDFVPPISIKDQAIRLLAERHLERREHDKGHVGNRLSWMITAVVQADEQHKHTIGALDLTRFPTPEALADYLEPPAQPKTLDPLAKTWRSGLVLDPFAGSGTTLAVATGHGRDAIGVDLDERNARLAEDRVGMFLTVETLTLDSP